MKPENLILWAIAGIGLWYLMRGAPAQAATTPSITADPFYTRAADLTAAIKAAEEKRAMYEATESLRYGRYA